MSVRIEVWGKYGCFSRPEMKVERVSYDVMTPSAARGIIEAIYWHPGMRYIIDKIYVMNPIRFTNIRRNEVKSIVSGSNALAAIGGGDKSLVIYTQEDIQQRAAMILQDIRYVIEAHFEMTEKAAPGDNPGKFQDILKRRLKKGQAFMQPYFGCREFPANYQEWQGGDVPSIDVDQDLGYMLYDMDFRDPSDIKPQFFRAILKHGVLDCRGVEVHS